MSADERLVSMPPGSVSHVGSFSWPTGVGPVPYLGAAAPPGWYMLKPGQGFQLEAIADYPSLFDVFGTRFGGDGVTTFGLPQAGLFTRGPDGTHALWSTFGEDAHQLTVPELAQHAHAVTDPQHHHFVPWPPLGPRSGPLPAGWGDTPSAIDDQGANSADAATGISIQNAGANQPHNNVPKTLVVNLIIKT